MTATEISICIPSKNRPIDIRRCLASIAAQDVAPKQIIIVDQSDHKYDLSPLPGLVHIYDPSINGSAVARNIGWRVATGGLLLYLDDDVELLPDCLRALADAANRFPDVVGFQCNIQNGDNGLTWTKLHNLIFNHGFFNSQIMRARDGIRLRRLSGCAAAIRTYLRSQIQFDESLIGYSYGEDWEFSYRMRLLGVLRLVPEARLVHHTSPVNRFRAEQLLRDRWDNFLYFYRKNNASHYWPNRLWRYWWMAGESILWLRYGMGCPILGWRTKRVPKRGLTLQHGS